jgi:alkanesulfonate monooxygenase SsuD/methylene tetrahydromethanopterin reductase-like flavin-dependent oxidoreductase (luciferase family)
MRFGSFYIMPQASGLSSQELVQQTLSEIEEAEALGFDHVWLTEHHATPFGTCASPSVLAAAVAMRTQRVGIGFAVHVAPLHHPLRLAEEIVLVDHLSQGRVLAGMGPGYAPFEFALYGVDLEERRARHWESVEIVLKAWRQEHFDHQGTYYRFDHASILPRPLQQPHPPLAIAASSSESVARTAQAGCRLLLLVDGKMIPEHLATYREAAGRAGYAPEEVEANLQYTGILRNIYVAQDENQALEEVRAATVKLLRLRSRLAQTSPSEAEFADQLEQYLRQRVIVGSAKKVREEIAALQAVGAGEVLCWFRWGDMSHTRVMESMHLFAAEVMPDFRQLS